MLRKSTDSLVIKPRLSAPARLAVALAAIVVVAGASLAGYYSGRAVLHQRLESRGQEIASLEEQLRESRAVNREQEARSEAMRARLSDELRSTREQLEAKAEATRERLETEAEATRERLQAELEAARGELESTRRRLENTQSSLTNVTRQLQIDQAAYKELRRELEDSNRQITELASELKFYRSIISPADGRSGVRIQEFELRPTNAPAEYRYRLVLIQSLEHETPVEGGVRFEISGTEGGEALTITSPSEAEASIPAKFKYFQNFAGTLKVPPDVVPAEVTVTFTADDDSVVERTYRWPEAATPGVD